MKKDSRIQSFSLADAEARETENIEGRCRHKIRGAGQSFTRQGHQGAFLRMQHRHARLQMRTRFFTNSAVPLWNRPPENVVNNANVGRCKEALDAYRMAAYLQMEQYFSSVNTKHGLHLMLNPSLIYGCKRT